MLSADFTAIQLRSVELPIATLNHRAATQPFDKAPLGAVSGADVIITGADQKRGFAITAFVGGY
jgi:hypothetical protein